MVKKAWTPKANFNLEERKRNKKGVIDWMGIWGLESGEGKPGIFQLFWLDAKRRITNCVYIYEPQVFLKIPTAAVGKLEQSLHVTVTWGWLCLWRPEFLPFQSWNMKQTNKQKTPQNNKEISFFFDNSPLIKFKSLLKNITTKMLVSVTYQVCFSLILKKKNEQKNPNPHRDRWRGARWWWCIWSRDLWKC